MIQLTVTPDKHKLLVRFPYNEDIVNRIKMVQGRVWSKTLHGWMFPFTKEMANDLEQVLLPYGMVHIDPFITSQVSNQDKDVLASLEIINDDKPVVLPEDMQFKIPPFEHQRKAISLCLNRKYYALFMEMGTGKTKVIVDTLGYKKKDGNLRALVVCPVSVMDNWAKEVRLHQEQLDTVVLAGSAAKRIEELKYARNEGVQVYVINYESLWRLQDEFLKYNWDVMILDESTKIKHRASKQAKGIMKIGEKIPCKYIMTGTPMPNSPLELFNQIKFLDPTIFGTNWYVFRDRYAVMGGYQGYQIIGWKNLPELSRKLAGISYRVLKKDCLDLPEKIYQEYRLTMPPKLREIYKSLAEDLVAQVNGQMITASVVLAKLIKLRQITSGFVYDVDSKAMAMPENPKLEQLDEVLEDILPNGHKVVIWTSFREEMRIIKELLSEKHKQTNLAIIDGTVSQGDRQIAIDRFQNDDACKVFLGQQHAGGLGITLTRGDYCIFFSNDYSPEIRLQCEDRLHRIGQKNNVTYIDLIMKGTVDVTIASMLKKKQDLSSKIENMNVQEMLNGIEY